jgi:hypothetical protein
MYLVEKDRLYRRRGTVTVARRRALVQRINACFGFTLVRQDSVCLVSMPSLMTFSATRRRTGSVCSATYTTPQPPSPIFSGSL